MKKIIAILLCLLTLLTLAACGNKVELHCDGEGCENVVYGKDHMDDSWIIYCKSCSEKLGLE